MNLKFDHKVRFQVCKKCGKGHDFSAITCHKPQGIDEEKIEKPCRGRLMLVEADEIELINYKKVKQ